MRRLAAWLAGPRGPWALVLIGLALGAPALRLGLGADNFVHRVRLAKLPLVVPVRGSVLLDLFELIPASDGLRAAMREAGLLPWWTHPQARGGFPRPLSAATHVLDYWLWPDDLVLQHLHSLLWYAAAILAAILLYRQLLRAPATAALAALLFAVADAHALPAAWLANRNSLVAFVLGALAIAAHVRWRRGPARGAGAPAFALAAFAAALLAAEAALASLGYIVAYELFLAHGPRARRALVLAPYLVFVVAWQVGYRALGYGVAGMGLYQDPVTDPLGFAAALAERLPLLLLALWARVSGEIWVFVSRPLQLGGLALALVVVVLLALLLRRPLREDALARFWAAGLLLSLVPACAVFPMDRLLVFAGLGAFGLLAGQAARLGWIGPRPAPAPPPARAARAGMGVLLAIHLVVAPVVFPLRIAGWRWFLRRLDRAEHALPDDAALTRQSVVWLNGMDLSNVAMVMSRHVRGAPLPRASHVLTSFFTPALVSRPDAHSLVIRPEGGFLARPMDRLMRAAAPPFRAGERVTTRDYEATVEAVTADGRPAQVVFRFRTPLEDPSLRWLYLSDGVVPHAFRLPRVGETVSLHAGWLW
ncbi:MAG: hypothetical protein HY744_12430 [Deltaproteobacteria bacterium]|nr:hypothetical protein [Deltaproteobacteria bacterium]